MPENISTETLHLIWTELCEKWFPDRSDLKDYRLCWSTRKQKRTLASCNVKLKRVRVAKELNHPTHLEWLEPLLYHELCHAVLGARRSLFRRKYIWHDREFRILERQHPGIIKLDYWIKTGGWQKAVRSERSRNRVFKLPW